jgi:hypothetical protein
LPAPTLASAAQNFSFGRRIASDLNHGPDQLAGLTAMIMRDVSKLWMNK